MGEKEEEDTAGGGEEEKEGRALEEEEQEEVATEDLVEKGTVALSETTTHWLLSVAGTCVEEGDEKAGESTCSVAGVDPRSGQSVCTLPLCTSVYHYLPLCTSVEMDEHCPFCSWLLRTPAWILRTAAPRPLTCPGETKNIGNSSLVKIDSSHNWPNQGSAQMIICVVIICAHCRKKKGTQSEAITLAEKLAQASNIDIFESTSQAFQDSGC